MNATNTAHDRGRIARGAMRGEAGRGRGLPLIVVISSLLVLACGPSSGDDSLSPPPSSPPVPTTAAASEEVAPVDVADLEQSVVKIRAEGTFAQPDGTAAFNVAGVGTGFLISEDGLVVTNNHVVTGAALLDVYTAGSDDPVNAQVLGASECADLAVIRLAGDGYAPLPFREAPVTVGLQVYAAGYPWVLEATPEDIDYTLTGGIVGSVETDGESNWASVDDVIEHDARILGGNSGGPLVDEQLAIVGINYAGVAGADQNFAIMAGAARPVIDRLAAGEDVDSIGINGQAIEGDQPGIFVASVASGSPADDAGIEPGDILVTLEELLLATDGTMRQYCDVIRTQGADSVMEFTVHRPSLDRDLHGQINGDPIPPVECLGCIIPPDQDGGGDASAASYAYATVTDDSGRVAVSIPTAWDDVDGSENPGFGPSVWASPDLDAFLESWDMPGIIVESAPGRPASDIPLLLEERDFSTACDELGTDDYDDGMYRGTLKIYGNCGGTDTYYVILAASPIDGDYLIRVEVQAVEERDLEAADEALNTFVATA